jgi:hypothetical protein
VPFLPEPPDLDDYGGEAVLEPPLADVTGYEVTVADQPVLLELWVEKSTVDDVVAPLCEALGVNLKIGKGNESITAAIVLLRRAEQAGRPVHVLYVSDLDTKGESMPVSVARQCEFWAPKLGIDVPVTVERLALTAGQVGDYGLPQAPETGDTELDALEALHPGELERIIREAVAPWRDPGLYHDAQAAWQEARQAVRQALRAIGDEAAGHMPALTERARAIHGHAQEKLQPLAQRWQQIVDAAEDELAGVRADAGEIEAAMNEAAEDAAGQAGELLPERPEPEPPEADRTGLLYDSERNWLDQARHYQRARRGGER